MTVLTEALVIRGRQNASLEIASLPDTPEAGSVRIDVAYCGICHSDLGALSQESPRVGGRLGHEISGIVAQTGSDRFRVGDRVVALSYDGYATQIDVSVGQVLPVPDGMPLHVACLAEPLACVLSGLERIDLDEHTDALVVGAGFMGLLLIRSLLARGIRVDVLDPRQAAQDRARAAGAHIVDPVGGNLYSLVFECSGSAAGLDTASERVVIDGVLSIVGYHQSNDGSRTVPMRDWNFKAITVINAHTRSPARVVRYMRKALVSLRDGNVEVTPWITESVPLSTLPVFLNNYNPTDRRDSVKSIAHIGA